MIYLINGDDTYYIEYYVNEIKKQHKDEEFIALNAEDKNFKIDDLINAVTSMSLFSSINHILLRCPYFLYNRPSMDEEKRIISFFKEYKGENIIIIYGDGKDFKTKSPIYNTLSKRSKLINCKRKNANEFINFAASCINEKGLKLNRQQIETIANRCHQDSAYLLNTIDKLALYPSKIDKNVIDTLCPKEVDYTVFQLVEAIGEKNIFKAITIFKEYASVNDNHLGLLSLLGTQFRFYYSLSIHRKYSSSYHEIASKMDVNEYRVKMSERILNNFSSNDLLKILYDLSEIDLKAKSDSSITLQERIELFILKNAR